MKGTISILMALLLLGCSKNETADSTDPISVFASIPPQAGLAKIIAGEHAEVHTLVGEGQSPHAYEPTARQLAKLGTARVFFAIGAPFEAKLLKKIVPLHPDLPIVRTQDQIPLRTMPHAHHGEACSHNHGEKDPHIWLNPLHARDVATRIAEQLKTIDPAHAAEYCSNLARLTTELETLDVQIRQQLKPYQGTRFYVFHPSFGYFADAYGLQQVPVELEGKSPSPRQLASLIEQARTDGVKVIFVQKQFPTDSAKAVANAIGGTVVQLDPLAEDLVANLREIAEAITQALEL